MMKEFGLRALFLLTAISFCAIALCTYLLPTYVPKPPKYERPVVETEVRGIAKWIAYDNGLTPDEVDFSISHDGITWFVIAYPKNGPFGTQKYIELDVNGELIAIGGGK